MSKVLTKLHLDVSKNGSQGIIYARQGEIKARTICMSLYNGSTPLYIPDGAVADLYIKRPGATQCAIACQVENGCVYCDMSLPAVSIAGNNECQLSVTDPVNSDIIYSPSWDLFVEELIADFNNLDQLPDYSALTSALSAAAAYKTKWSNPSVNLYNAEETHGDVSLTEEGVLFDLGVHFDAKLGDEEGVLVETGPEGKLVAGRKIVTGHEDPSQVGGLRPGDIYIKY